MKWHIGLVCQSFTSRNIGLWRRKEQEAETERKNNRDAGKGDGRRGWKCVNVVEKAKD